MILINPSPNPETLESGTHDKCQTNEEPDEAKVSRPVLKESSGGRLPVRL